jgi:hypothetical protein
MVHLSSARGRTELNVADENVAVLAQHMSDVRHTGLFPVALAVELCLRVSYRLMRVVLALLPVEVFRILVGLLLWAKALEAR